MIPDPEDLVLGMALADERACAAVLSELAIEDFTTPLRKATFRAIARVSRRGEPVDMIAVHDDAKREGDAPEGFASALAGYTTAGASHHDHRRFIRRVQEESLRRKLAATCENAHRRLMDGEDPDSVRREIAEAAYQAGRVDATTWAPALLDATLERVEDQFQGKRPSRLATGWWMFDMRFGGLPLGVTTLAAQTGSGKTSLAISFLMNYCARTNVAPALFCSLEMVAADVIDRMVSHESGIHTGRVDSSSSDTARLSSAEKSAWRECVRAVLSRPFHIWTPTAPTPGDIFDKARAIATTNPNGLGPIVVDYDEFVQGTGNNRSERLDNVCRGLKRVAQELKVPLILLSQYNRDGSEIGQRPQNRWLMGASQKEHVSSMILHWFWPHYWIRSQQAQTTAPGYQGPNHGKIFVTKNRGGPVGAVEMLFYPETSRFVDPTDEETRRVAV